MEIFKSTLYVLAVSVRIFIDFLMLAMFIRAILSWFASPDSGISRFFTAVTEPFIVPMRVLLVRMNLLQDSPMDFSFLFTYLALFLIQLFLPAISF